MPTTIYDSSLITKRAQAKTIAKSFLQRLNTNGTVNQTTSYGPQLGISSDSIINEVKNGTMKYITKCDGATNINAGCCPAPTYAAPGLLLAGSFFIYLNCVIVTWAPPENAGKAGPLTYNITANSNDGGQTVTAISSTNSYSFTTLTPLTHYTFTVTAQNEEGITSPITSYSIYAPPLTTQSNTTSLELSPNYAWAPSSYDSASPFTFVKQTASNYKCFGTLNEIALLYPSTTLGTGTIFPLSELVAYATMTSPDFTGPDGLGVYKTSDGGLSWTSITAGKIYLTLDDYPDFSYWWSESEGITVGDQFISVSGPDIYYTDDGGTTWSLSTLDPGPTSFTAPSAYSGTYSAIGDTIWISTTEFLGNVFNLWVYKSTDKGHIFTPIQVNSNPIRGIFFSVVSFADSNYGALALTTYCAYTIDGGATWTERPELAQIIGNILDIVCINQNLVYVVGYSYINGVPYNTLYSIANLFSGSLPLQITRLTYIDGITQTRFSNSTTGYATSNLEVGIIKKYLGTNTPSPPTINSIAYPGSSSVLLSVQSSNYEFPIQSFIITPYDSAGIALAPQTFTSRQVLVTGLTNSASYTFKAQAVSAYGAVSAMSDFSNSFIPLILTVPQPTWLVGIFFSNANTVNVPAIPRVTLQFVKPLNDGGSAITSYNATIVQANGVITSITGITEPVYNYTLLSTSSITSATVYAVNGQGAAISALSSGAIGYNGVRVPTIVFGSSGVGTYTVTIGNVFISSTWPTAYYILYTIDASTFNTVTTCSPNLYTLIDVTAASQSVTVTGLAPGTYYVYARVNISAASTSILSITVT